MQSDIGGPHIVREWGLKTPIGDVLRECDNTNKEMSRLQIFYFMFPPSQLEAMVVATNSLMRHKGTSKN